MIYEIRNEELGAINSSGETPTAGLDGHEHANHNSKDDTKKWCHKRSLAATSAGTHGVALRLLALRLTKRLIAWGMPITTTGGNTNIAGPNNGLNPLSSLSMAGTTNGAVIAAT
jgi:hypothetical protein